MLPFTSLLERPLLWWTNARSRDMKARVNGDLRRAQRTLWLVGVKFLVVMALFIGMVWLPDKSGWREVCAILVGAILSTFAMAAMERQQAYGQGWMDGRRLALDAIYKAQREGASIDDAIHQELYDDMMRQIL